MAWISRDQAVAKVHHRLVAIYPFPNGNGRHARACCDLLMKALGGPPLTWGGSTDPPDHRRRQPIARSASTPPVVTVHTPRTPAKHAGATRTAFPGSPRTARPGRRRHA
ncbi:Fic family protein [Sanguibacter antarcticus]|uniref:Fic family protein n=1 Tax=Sanguibacter antarcticus TaxID=372484 RepID=UPI001B8078BB